MSAVMSQVLLKANAIIQQCNNSRFHVCSKVKMIIHFE